jgi:hypothetical protein
MLLAYLGIKEDKLNLQYNKRENIKFMAEITEIEDRTQADVNHNSLMKQCLNDVTYLASCQTRDLYENRMPDCEIDIDRLGKLINNDDTSNGTSKVGTSVRHVDDNIPAITIKLAPLRPTVSVPINKLQSKEIQSPTFLRAVANRAIKSQTGSTFEEMKQRRLTMNNAALLAKINEIKKLNNGDSDSDDEPVTVVKVTSARGSIIQPISAKDGTFIKKEDRAYVARLGIQFHLIFSRAQDQIYTVNSNALLRSNSNKPQLTPMRNNTRISRQQVKTTVSTPTLPPISNRSNKGKSFIKLAGKPKIQKEKLTQDEMDALRHGVIAARMIYNQNSIKTEEAASIERYVKNTIFSDIGIMDKEYLSLGASLFLK